MNFDLTDEQQMLQAAAREFLAARLKSERIRELAESDDAFSEDLWREMSELNWPGLMVSGEVRWPGARHGRAGGADGAARLCARSRARSSRPSWPRIALEAAATDEQKERYLAPLATGEQRGTVALWDAGAGWTPDDITLEPEACQRRLRAERREAVRARRRHRGLLHRRRDGRPAVHRRARRGRASRSRRRRRSTRPASSTR